MGARSEIEWTHATWNPVTGCDRLSAGCAHCYAAALAHRLQAMGQPAYRNGFALTLHPHLLDVPLHWRRPRTIFVCSMADLFHEQVPLDFLRDVFQTIRAARQHTFQVLTKRAERLAEVAPRLPWPEHLWAGVTVERADYQWRVEHLRRVPAAVRFLSLEPLLGPLPELDLTGIHWVVAAGESGPGARPLQAAWLRGIHDRCRDAGVPFWLKQLGGWPDRRGGAAALLDGRLYKEFPAAHPRHHLVRDGVLPGLDA